MASTGLAHKAFLFKMTPEMHAELKRAAREAGYTMQAYMEMKIYGEIRPRGPYGPRPELKSRDQRELPLTG